MASPSHPALQQLDRLNSSSPDFQDQLIKILSGREYKRCASKIQSNDLTWLVDHLDKVLDDIDPSSVAFRKCLRELKSTCSNKTILPRSYSFSSNLTIDPDPFAGGGYAVVYKGTADGSSVCVKRIRVYGRDDPRKAQKILCQEAVVWKRLKHPNLIPFLGTTTTPLQLISEWMSGGTLPGYIKKHPDADRLGLLSDVTMGLCYLHSCNVVHGDLKGENILVDDFGHARIADFGLANVARNPHSKGSASGHDAYTAQWAAPEVLMDGTYSKEADIFSFAMVVIEVFTGSVPFVGCTPVKAMFEIMEGRRPPKPTHPTFTEDLWTFMQHCWDPDPHLRPEASETLKVLLETKQVLLSHGNPSEKHTRTSQVSETAPGHAEDQPQISNPPTPTNGTSPALTRLIEHAFSPHELISLIGEVFSNEDDVMMIGYLHGNDTQTFIDVVYKALDLPDLPQPLQRKSSSALRKICGRNGLLPRSLQIPLCYDRSDDPLYRGGFADVWMGEHQGRRVAVKVLRVYPSNDLVKIASRFCEEVVMWATLHHPNVLSLLGVTVDNHHFAMVSDWMVNGTINEFVKANRDANRFELLKDAARGLIYLHSRGMIHGDLRGSNILIDENGHACLADFGLLTSVSEFLTTSGSPMMGGSVRWMSPELIDPEQFGLEDSRPTKESDCYAFGMVIYEVLSGQVPFASFRDFVVIRKVIEGEHPERPDGSKGAWFTDGIWEMLELCWKHLPSERISAETILLRLEGTPSPIRPDPNVQSCVTTPSDCGASIASRMTTSNSDLPIVRIGDGLPIPSPGSLPNLPEGMSSTIPQDNGELPDQPQTRNSKRKRIARWLTRGVQRIFNKDP